MAGITRKQLESGQPKSVEEELREARAEADALVLNVAKDLGTLFGKHNREGLNKIRESLIQDEITLIRERLVQAETLNTSEFRAGVIRALLTVLDGYGQEDQVSSPVFCEHANENPLYCRCPSNCYCKRHTCANRPS